MIVFHDPAEVPDGFGPSVVAIGKFDGVHAGHRAVLERARVDAATGGAKVVAVTFDRNPLSILRPEACPESVIGMHQKLRLLEETGIDARAPGCLLSDWRIENVYEIYPRWRHRYAPGVTHNREHVFGLRVPEGAAVRLNPREHDAFVWLPWRAAADRCFSPTNAEACLLLPRLAGVVP